ncbi:AAA family ATPase [Vibrio campbellii]|uniref:AAA family ATPase n=1 Tax=Vibrio campbellii TaxID=680 RepID=UPI0038579BB6
MPTLKNITVSNIRRFASDVSIPVSPQATIFLAPNGTGKTALFEAMELAITGQVSRLDEDVFAIIRDSEEKASVCLDFDDFQQSASVTIDGNVNWSPAETINGEAQASDISYLLRLTHLLDQRDKNWFVQGEAKEAGDLLTKLPIGQEAQKLWSLMPKLRRPIAKLLAEKESEKDAALGALEQWDDLIKERKITQDRTGTKNISLESLRQDLIPFMDENNSNELDSLERLSVEHNVCLSNINSKLEASRSRLTALEQLTITCADFSNLKKQENNLNSDYGFAQDEKASVQIERDKLFVTIQECEIDLEKTNIELNVWLSDKRALEKLKHLDQKEHETKEQILQELKLLQVHESATTQANNALNQLRDELTQHLEIEARQRDLVLSQERLESAKHSLSIWKEEVTRVNTFKQQLLALEHSLTAAKSSSQSAKVALDEVIENSTQNKIKLNTVQQSSDQVRTAVAEIAASIAGKQGQCPVCGENHGIDLLEQKMLAQLKGANPQLQRLSNLDAQLTEQVFKCTQKYDKAIENEKQISNQIISQRELLDQSVGRINNIRLEPFFKSSELEDVERDISTMADNLTIIGEKIAFDLSNLSKKPTSEILTKAEQTLADVKYKLEQLQKTVFKRQQVVEEIRVDKSQLNAELKSNLNTESIENEINTLNENLIKNRTLINNLKIEHDEKKNKISIISNSINDFQSKLNETHNMLMHIQKSWKEQKLDGNPNLDALKEEISAEEKLANEFEQSYQLLNMLRTKIAQLQGAENLKAIQKKIDQLRGEVNEVSYRLGLENSLNKCTQELVIINDKKAALESFSNELSKEIDQIQSKVASIEPLWQALLSRVVRESRFSKTGLQVERKWNKAHATVNVPLSNKTVSASKVASEAQKTDLQLTFLLSMALANTWSPWRALLLDDPTQHHDLVHASAIFDVLRDYILEYKFQLLMTTHDPVQANYLKRKLENDGIDVHIVNLVPSSDGVRAKVKKSNSSMFQLNE